MGFCLFTYWGIKTIEPKIFIPVLLEVSWFRKVISQFSASPIPSPVRNTTGKAHRSRLEQFTGNSEKKRKRIVTATILITKCTIRGQFICEMFTKPRTMTNMEVRPSSHHDSPHSFSDVRESLSCPWKTRGGQGKKIPSPRKIFIKAEGRETINTSRLFWFSLSWWQLFLKLLIFTKKTF